MKSAKTIALSGVSAALCAVFITLGSYIAVIDLSCFMFAGFALMLPLYKKSLVGGVAAYIAGGLIGLLFSGMNFFTVLPYFVWFGLHPILNFIQVRYKINKYLAFGVKLLIFNLAIFIILRFTMLFVTKWDFINEREYIFYIAGSVFFIFYDMAVMYIQRAIDAMLGRVVK